MCRDPFLSSLADYGYSVVRLPMADLAPLQMLLRRGDDLDRLGRLSTVLLPGRPPGLPRVARDRRAASVSGRRTGGLDVAVGLSLLGGVIAAMGGSRAGLEDTYRSARTITFEFTDVTEDSVELAALDQCLSGARLNPRSAHLGALFDAGEVHVTTAVIRSRALTVDARDEQGAAVSVELPALAHVSGGRLTVSHSSDDSAAIVYTGRESLAFGFRAIRLFYEDGRYAGFEPLTPGKAGLRDIRPRP